MSDLRPARRPGEHSDPQFAERWSPSCFNEQPWRFSTATRDQILFADYAQVLLQANRSWAAYACV